jgi:hypothetical protein
MLLCNILKFKVWMVAHLLRQAFRKSPLEGTLTK